MKSSWCVDAAWSALANGTRLTPTFPARKQFVRAVLDPARHVSIGRSAVGRVVLEASILGRVVGRCNDDAIRQMFPCDRGCKPE